jgi:hypothetical protein
MAAGVHNCAFQKGFISLLRCQAYSLHFGMRRGIIILQNVICPSCYYLPIFYNNGSKRLSITGYIFGCQLHGLQGVLDGCGCDELDGLDGDTIPRNTIMSSTDIVALQFDKIGFKGKWLELIGDPSPGFTAMIFGRPKMGKSYMAVDFAGYLARNHGSVLYVAREEGIDDTLQKKLKDKEVAHPDLFVSDYLPNDLSDYDFIFFDSVNKLKLTPDDLDELRRTYPKKSFIFIFQTTKAGSFRGSNDYMHDVDVVIEVPEKGLAVQNGRFNQGGEMEIFE